MAFDINETRSLLGVIEQAFPPNPVLINTFFPKALTFPTSVLDVDYKKGGRRLAPFVVPGSKGVNMAREGYITKSYKPWLGSLLYLPVRRKSVRRNTVQATL